MLPRPGHTSVSVRVRYGLGRLVVGRNRTSSRAPCAEGAPPELYGMGQSLRSLAVKAGVTVHECARQLRRAGFEVAVGKQRLDGPEHARACGAGTDASSLDRTDRGHRPHVRRRGRWPSPAPAVAREGQGRPRAHHRDRARLRARHPRSPEGGGEGHARRAACRGMPGREGRPEPAARLAHRHGPSASAACRGIGTRTSAERGHTSGEERS